MSKKKYKKTELMTGRCTDNGRLTLVAVFVGAG